jgi:hypothetical protein
MSGESGDSVWWLHWHLPNFAVSCGVFTPIKKLYVVASDHDVDVPAVSRLYGTISHPR